MDQKGQATIEAALLTVFSVLFLSLAFVIFCLCLSKSIGEYITYESALCVMQGDSPKLCQQSYLKKLQPLPFNILRFHIQGQAYIKAHSWLRLEILEHPIEFRYQVGRSTIKKATRWYKY